MFGLIPIVLGVATGITYSRYKEIIDSRLKETIGDAEYEIDVLLNLTPNREELSKVDVSNVDWRYGKNLTIVDGAGNSKVIKFTEDKPQDFPLFTLEKDFAWIEENSPQTFGRYNLPNELMYRGINKENGEVFMELYLDRKAQKYTLSNFYK
jgi:hypothetical protein